MRVVNHLDIMVVDKQQKKTLVTDVTIQRDSNTRKQKPREARQIQGADRGLEGMWRVKASVVPVAIGAIGAVTLKLGERRQKILGAKSEIYRLEEHNP